MIIIYIIIGIIIGYGIFIYLNKNKFSKSNGLNDSEKILDFINKNKRITNNDVEKLLNVSDSTATRYLQRLEDAKKIKQIGNTGSGVYYIKL